jgi:hypothetical protein
MSVPPDQGVVPKNERRIVMMAGRRRREAPRISW